MGESNPPVHPPVPRLIVPVGSSDHADGPPDAPVTLVEYGDYECPYCGRAYPVLKEVARRMPGRVRFVFRHFPQNTVHRHAGVAAQAAEAAGAQGKFWGMHGLLFEHQDAPDGEDLLGYALRLGLEVYRFESDLASERFARRVESDYQDGLRGGVRKTPTLFINGRWYAGPLDPDAIQAAVEGAASGSA